MSKIILQKIMTLSVSERSFKCIYPDQKFLNLIKHEERINYWNKLFHVSGLVNVNSNYC